MTCPHPECITQLQRTANGTLQDGVAAHFRTVHPDDPIPEESS